MWISKIQKLEPCKFNKHLFLKNLFEFRSSLREIFFEKMFLELDKSFSVIVKEFMFSEAANRGFHKEAVLKKKLQYSQENTCVGVLF